MRWFDGSIPAAIASAKQRRCVFVVVITGTDELSGQLMTSWESDDVSSAARDSCVAIRLDADSEACVQFSQIYPVVCVPSSFFIGENGLPLEVIAGSVSSQELQRRILSVCQVHVQKQDAAPQTTSCNSTVPEEPLSEEAGASSHMTTAEATPQPEEQLDAKVERLTKRLEERQDQKRKAEEEEEQKKEVERRKLGKEMLDYKRKQEDEKTRRLLEERNREKEEERAARERVKQQIALDRADRVARYAQNQKEVEAAQKARATEQEARREAVQRGSAVARLQFRLPDGSSFSSQFPSETRLQEARQFAAQEVGGRYGHFSLATMFPRREFSEEDLQKSLLELELAPSASIVLLPAGLASHSVVQSSGVGGVWAVLSSLLFPFLAVWRFIRGFLLGSARPAAPAKPRDQPPAATGSAPGPHRDELRKRFLEKKPEDFKRDGRIYRLRTQEEDEDDNNTWNGNSTQQM